MSIVVSKTPDGKTRLELMGHGDPKVLADVKDTDTCNYDSPELDRVAVIACAVYYGLMHEGLIVGIPKPTGTPTGDQ